MAISRFDKTQPPGPRMSRCVVRDNTVYLAGLTASDATQDIKGQTKQILDKIDGYLAQAGTSKSNLLSANLWINDRVTRGLSRVLSASRPFASASRTAVSISRCEVTPTTFRNLRMSMLKRSSFIVHPSR